MYQLMKRNEKGASAVVVSIALFVMFGFVAFAVDMGLARVQVRQDQTAADAAALAAVGVLTDGGTRADAASAAIRISWENLKGTVPSLAAWTDTWQSCSDSGRDLGVYTVTATAPVSTSCISFKEDNTRVRVRVPTINVDSHIAKLMGVNSIATAAAAEAIVKDANGGGFAVFGISENCSADFAVEIKGGTNVPDGSVHSNNDLRIESPTNLPDGATYRTSISNEAGVSASQSSTVTNPLSHVDMADYRPGGDKAVAAGPNYYNMGSSVINNSDVTGPGIYYTTGSVYLKSGLAFEATFIIDNPTLKKSGFETNGTGYDLTYYEDKDANPDKLLVFTNTAYSEQCKPQSSPAIHFNGSSGSYTGVLYAPNAGVHLNGSSSGSVILGSIVGHTVHIDGTGNVLQNDGNFVPSAPLLGLYR